MEGGSFLMRSRACAVLVDQPLDSQVQSKSLSQTHGEGYLEPPLFLVSSSFDRDRDHGNETEKDYKSPISLNPDPQEDGKNVG